MDTLLILAFVLGALMVSFVAYMLPSIAAYHFRKRNAEAILVCNILFGWTFVGWGVCMVWALMEDRP